MDCPNGCTFYGNPQEMRSFDKGHYACPQCQHEVRENEPGFICDCAKCKETNSAFQPIM